MLSCFACLKLYIVYGYWRQLPIPWRFPSITYMHFDLFFCFPTENSMILKDIYYHTWSELPLRLIHFHVLIRILTISTLISLIYSLYNEGRSQQDCSSSENHIEFSVVMLHCPVESPPFHFPGQQLLLTFIDDLTKIFCSCNTSLLFWRNILII